MKNILILAALASLAACTSEPEVDTPEAEATIEAVENIETVEVPAAEPTSEEAK